MRGLDSHNYARRLDIAGRALDLSCSNRTRGKLGCRIGHWGVTDVLLGLLPFRGFPEILTEDYFLLVSHQSDKRGATAVGAILLFRTVDAKVAADSILQ